jgi:Bacteriophage HK97-gp10, putative tail-component
MFEYTVTTDAAKMAVVFEREATLAPTKVAAVTQRNGQRLLEMVQALSPYKTGEYKRSHQIQLYSIGGMYSAEVYTDLERGAILEFGGPQTLSDGSQVDRDPHPHYRPAFEFVSAQYYEELARYMTL